VSARSIGQMIGVIRAKSRSLPRLTDRLGSSFTFDMRESAARCSGWYVHTWIRDSCSNENICEEGYTGTFLGTNPKVVRIEEKFAFKLPEGLPMEVSCPLLCGGGTVFEAVVDYVECGTLVAVASIGGLGTAAIKFAKAFGAHVTALSRSDAKKEKSLGVGADEFSAFPKFRQKIQGWQASLISLSTPRHTMLTSGLSWRCSSSMVLTAVWESLRPRT